MINWVDLRCKAWGRQKYWLYCGGNGFPSRSMLGKMIEEGLIGAGCSQFVSSYPEVLNEENLIVENAVKALAEESRAIVTVHYVIRMPARRKFHKLNISKNRYYEILDRAQIYIANSIESQESK